METRQKKWLPKKLLFLRKHALSFAVWQQQARTEQEYCQNKYRPYFEWTSASLVCELVRIHLFHIMAPKSKAKKAANPKFASKVVGEIFENLIQTKLKAVKKNPKTTAKWMEKMKLSVLKKLSHASKIAFSSSESNNINNIPSMRAEVQQLREKIQQQAESIRETATNQMKKANMTIEQDEQADGDTYVPGRFEARVQRIKERLDVFAPMLQTNIKDMSERVHAFNTSITATETDWKQSSRLLQQRAAAAPVVGGAVPPALSNSKVTQQPTLKDKQGPGDTLYNVLAKS